MGYTSESSGSNIKKLQDRIATLPHQPKTLSVKANLSTVEGSKKLIDELTQWTDGSLKLDILVNNAGLEVVKPLGKISVEDYDAVYNLNVRGALLLTQAVLPFLNPNSRVINLTSVGARTGFKELSLYCSSKAAVEGLTRCWAAELGVNGTTVNAVAPGPVQSDMLDNIPADIVKMQKDNTPIQNRLGTVQEVSNIVAWLASPSSSWVTGQVICASGGWAMY